MVTFRTEIQQLIDSITVGLPGESWADRGERVLGEAFDVVGRSLRAIDEENKVADLAELQTELEAAALVAAGRLMADRPFIARALKMAMPFIVEAGIDWVATNSGPPVQFARERLAPWFTRARRIAERGEQAFAA